MKNFLIVLTLCASGVSSVFAQTPAADAKAAVKAAPAAAKAAAAPAAAKAAAAPAAAKVAAAPAAAKAAVQAAPAQAAAAATTAAAPAKKMVKKAAAKTMATSSSKMMYKCPKGDALCDTGGKCPKCGEEMVSMSGAPAKKTAVKPMSKVAPTPKAEAKKG